MSGGNDWETAKLPAEYSKAKKALAECVTIDGCRKWKVVADAIASYAKQFNDRQMLEDAHAIRNRAGRRMGELLNERPSQQGAHLKTNTVDKSTVLGRTEMAKDAGLSDYERKSALRLAAMPQKEFDRREREPGLGQQKGKTIPPGTIRCPHCGGVIVL